MCDGRIHRTQRFPANPVNGQVPVWNALTKKWEAQNQSGGGSLPTGSNPNDMLYWDATNEEWIVGAEVSGFNPTADYSIDGRFDFSNALLLSQVDPSSAFSPITGVSIFADTSDNFTVKRADGIRYSFSSAYLSVDRKFSFPDRDGKFAMSDFDNEFTATQSFTQINTGRSGVAGKVNWYNDAGSLVSASGIVPGASNFFHEGNNFNFRTNATGFFFGSGSTWVNPTARLHVRGDGTNLVARFESSGGANIVSVRESDHTILFGTGAGTFPQIGLQVLNNPTAFAPGNGHYLAYKSNVNIDWPSPMHSFWGENQIYSKTTLSNNPAGIAAFNGTFGISNVAASTFDYRMLSINYTINNTAVSNRTATGIFLNATETALNGMNHLLMDFQVGSISQFRVFKDGTSLSRSGFFVGSSSGSTAGISGVNSNNGPYTTFNTSVRIQDFRDPNASGYSYFFFSSQYVNLQYTSGEGGFVNIGRGFAPTSGNGSFVGLTISNEINQTGGANGITRGLLIAPVLTSASDFRGIEITMPSQSVIIGRNSGSALLQLNSTSKGFLLPRMTSAQRDAIAAPDEGLEIYNTTEKAKQFWNGIAWKTILTA